MKKPTRTMEALMVLALIAMGTTGCTDECYSQFGDRDCREYQDQRRCGGEDEINAIQACRLDSDSGCYVWDEGESCGDRQLCTTVVGNDVECLCQNECIEDGASTCSENVISACNADADGCLVATEDNCGVRDLVCQWNDADQQHRCCRTDCQLGDRQCNGNILEWCALDSATGCGEWAQYRNCSSRGGCEVTGGEAACAIELECDVNCRIGATRCQANTIQVCEADGDGCPSWSNGTTCAGDLPFCTTDDAGTRCEGSCSHACSAGATRCNDSVIQNCEVGAGGCRGWVDGPDCAPETCEMVAGSAECSGGGCSDECGSEGASCNDLGTILTLCERNSLTGCLELNVQDCTASGGTCVGGMPGVPAACSGGGCDECGPAGVTQCNGNVIETCTMIECLTWIPGVNCADTPGNGCYPPTPTQPARCGPIAP